jgi:hypothetical protein
MFYLTPLIAPKAVRGALSIIGLVGDAKKVAGYKCLRPRLRSQALTSSIPRAVLMRASLREGSGAIREIPSASAPGSFLQNRLGSPSNLFFGSSTLIIT